MHFHRKSCDSEVSGGLEQSSARRVLRLRSTPVRRARMYMNFLRKSYDSEVSDGLEQPSAQRGLRLRSTPIRRAKMYGFP